MYLFVKDDIVELKNAHNLWGSSTPTTQSKLLEMTLRKKVKNSCIISGTYTADRGGTSVMMSSKMLKAIN